MKVETVGWACGMHPACKRSDHDHVAEDALVRRAGVVRWLRDEAEKDRYAWLPAEVRAAATALRQAADALAAEPADER